MKFSLLLITLTFALHSSSQIPESKYVKLTFTPRINGESILIESESSEALKKEKATISNFKWYISNVTLLHDGKVVFSEANSIHLLDVSKIGKPEISLSTPSSIAFDQVSFFLGLDSTINVSGNMEGDLDPTLGMYWTWQSGYIHFKLEGSTTEGKDFSYHLGGYRSPFSTCEKVTLNCSESWNGNISVSIDKFLDSIDLNEESHIMSPGKRSKELIKLAALMFEVSE